MSERQSIERRPTLALGGAVYATQDDLDAWKERLNGAGFNILEVNRFDSERRRSEVEASIGLVCVNTTLDDPRHDLGSSGLRRSVHFAQDLGIPVYLTGDPADAEVADGLRPYATIGEGLDVIAQELPAKQMHVDSH